MHSKQFDFLVLHATAMSWELIWACMCIFQFLDMFIFCVKYHYLRVKPHGHTVEEMISWAIWILMLIFMLSKLPTKGKEEIEKEKKMPKITILASIGSICSYLTRFSVMLSFMYVLEVCSLLKIFCHRHSQCCGSICFFFSIGPRGTVSCRYDKPTFLFSFAVAMFCSLWVARVIPFVWFDLSKPAVFLWVVWKFMPFLVLRLVGQVELLLSSELFVKHLSTIM